METLKTIDRVLGKTMRAFCVFDLLALTAVLGGVVFIRFVDIHVFTSNQTIIEWFKLSWSDEVTEWLMSSLIFIAAAELWRERDHFKVEIISGPLAQTLAGKIFLFMIEIMAAVFILAFAIYSYDLTVTTGRSSPILAWPMSWWYAPMPTAGAIMFAYSVRNVVVRIDGLFKLEWFPKEAARP